MCLDFQQNAQRGGCPVAKKFKIAWLPGDGVGVEVMEAAKIVLDKVGFDAGYIHGDIGWEFWCKEGDAFPARTIELLKSVDAAMFGAITSKPVKAAEQELVPALQGKNMVYRSPIVRMRQLFDLYVCLRPCKAYAQNPLNFKEGIDLVVFRENTEDLYAGVEFNTVPDRLRDTLTELSPPFKAFKDLPGDQYAISCKINTKKGSERIVRAAFEFAQKFGRKKVTVVHGEAGGEELPCDRHGRCQHRRDDNVAAQEPVQLRRAGGAEPLRRHHLGPLRADGGRARIRLLRQHRPEARSVRAHPRLGAQVRGAVQGEPDRHDPGGQDDARLAG
jgi:hypothetical protein